MLNLYIRVLADNVLEVKRFEECLIAKMFFYNKIDTYYDGSIKKQEVIYSIALSESAGVSFISDLLAIFKDNQNILPTILPTPSESEVI